MKPVRLDVDRHELRSAVPAALERLGVSVAVKSLAAGDYDVGAGTLIERKTTVDLVMSLRTGRLWRQMGALRHRSRFPVLLIEGRPPRTVLGAAAARGLVLAISDQGIVVLSSSGAPESAEWIASIAGRRQIRVPRDRLPHAYHLHRPDWRPGEALLCAIDGISVHHARALLDAFGTVRRVVGARPEDWLAVRGIGPVRARAMSECFGADELNLPPPQRRKDRGRAT
jgi:ERCC4-type nuclease